MKIQRFPDLADDESFSLHISSKSLGFLGSTSDVDSCVYEFWAPQARKFWKIVDTCLRILGAEGAKILSTFDRENRRHVSTNSKPAAGAKKIGTFDGKIVDTCLRILSPPQARKFWGLLTRKIVDTCLRIPSPPQAQFFGGLLTGKIVDKCLRIVSQPHARKF